MESLLNETRSGFTKPILREKLEKIRLELNQERRAEASKALISNLIDSLARYETILSFMSFRGEIDTHPLNHFLAKAGKLVLPKIEGDEMRFFRVSDCEHQISTNRFGLKEPIAARCTPVLADQLEVILVPALGFDRRKHRLGYGGGFYDRLLCHVSCRTMGIAFCEQQLSFDLPTESYDIPVDEVLFF